MPETSVGHVARSHAAVDLQWWAERDWTGAVHLDAMAELDRLAVHTRNTTYEITVLSPHAGEVLVRGGRFFPAATRVRVAGASVGGSLLKMRVICPGFLMELQHDGRTIITTRVQSIAPIAENGPAH